MAILPQSTRIVSISSIVTVTETFPHTVPRSLASSDANEVLTDISNAERLVDPLLRIGAQPNDIYPVVEVDLSFPQQQQHHHHHPNDDEGQQQDYHHHHHHQEDKQNSTRRRSNKSKKSSAATKTKRRISDPTQEQKQELATEAAMKLHLSLISSFNGNDEQSKYILLTRINMVSDGCDDCDDCDDCKDYSPGPNKNNKSSARRLLLPFWSSKKSNKSKKNKKGDDSNDYLDTNDDSSNNSNNAAAAAAAAAKLEISYCLFVRDSGKVAFVENKSYTKCPRNNQNQQIGNSNSSSGGGKGGKSKENYDSNIVEGKQLVMELTNRCAHEIQKEIMSSSQQHPIPRRMPSIVPPPLSS